MVLQTIKHEVATWPSKPTPRYRRAGGEEIAHPHKRSSSNVHSGVIHSGQTRKTHGAHPHHRLFLGREEAGSADSCYDTGGP